MCRLMRVQVCIYIHRAFPSTFQVKGMYSQHVGKPEGYGAVTLNRNFTLGSPAWKNTVELWHWQKYIQISAPILVSGMFRINSLTLAYVSAFMYKMG